MPPFAPPVDRASPIRHLEALAALLARHSAAEVDASYAAYDGHSLDEPDEWGGLASFRRAVAA